MHRQIHSRQGPRRDDRRTRREGRRSLRPNSGIDANNMLVYGTASPPSTGAPSEREADELENALEPLGRGLWRGVVRSTEVRPSDARRAAELLGARARSHGRLRTVLAAGAVPTGTQQTAATRWWIVFRYQDGHESHWILQRSPAPAHASLSECDTNDQRAYPFRCQEMTWLAGARFSIQCSSDSLRTASPAGLARPRSEVRFEKPNKATGFEHLVWILPDGGEVRATRR